MPFLLELHNLALISNVVKFNYNYKIVLINYIMKLYVK